MRAAGLPYVIADIDGALVAYGYLTPHHPRAAYCNTVADSIYVAVAAQSRGIGRALLDGLIAYADRRGLAQIIASITAQGGEAPTARHARAGFVQVGRMHAAIRRHRRWLECVSIQRPLAAVANMTD